MAYDMVSSTNLDKNIIGVHLMIHSKIIGIGVITGLCSMAALAEPAVQPGDTLESLSKVKVTTTVNGQPGSISDLVNSGQVQ